MVWMVGRTRETNNSNKRRTYEKYENWNMPAKNSIHFRMLPARQVIEQEVLNFFVYVGKIITTSASTY